MAHFMGGVKGQSNNVETRLGSKRSGLVTFANGWNQGVEVRAETGPDGDVFKVYATGGSNDSQGRLLGKLVNGQWIPQGGTA